MAPCFYRLPGQRLQRLGEGKASVSGTRQTTDVVDSPLPFHTPAITQSNRDKGPYLVDAIIDPTLQDAFRAEAQP